MNAIRVALVLAVTLWGTAGQVATAGSDTTQLAAVSSACTTEVRLGQAHAELDRSFAVAGRTRPGVDEYLALHAQAREAIQRPAMLPGAELRAQASPSEHSQQ